MLVSQEGTVHRKTKNAQPAARAFPALCPAKLRFSHGHAPTREQGIPAGSPHTDHQAAGPGQKPRRAAFSHSSSRPAGERSFFIFRCAVPLGSTM